MATGLLTPAHIAILLLVVLLIFGPKRLPQVGHALGRGIREFKQGITGSDDRQQVDSPPGESSLDAIAHDRHRPA